MKQTAEALTRMISNEILDEEAAEQMYNAQVAFLSPRSDIPFTTTDLKTPNKLQHPPLSSPYSNTFISPISYTGAGGAPTATAAGSATGATTASGGGPHILSPADRSSLDPLPPAPVRNNALFPKSSSDSMLVGRYSNNNSTTGGGIPYNNTNTYVNNINMTDASQGFRSPFGNFNSTTTPANNTTNNSTSTAPYTNDQPATNQQYSTTYTPSHPPPTQPPQHLSHNITSPIQTTVKNPTGNLISLSSETLLTSYFYEWNKKLFLTPDVGYDSYEDPLSVEGQARIYR